MLQVNPLFIGCSVEEKKAWMQYDEARVHRGKW